MNITLGSRHAPPRRHRATVLAMLTEAGDAAPPTAARFRRVVSVRKLRARLGGSDPATLSRTLNAIEAEVVRAGLADLALPELPVEIAEQMRAVAGRGRGTARRRGAPEARGAGGGRGRAGRPRRGRTAGRAAARGTE